MGVITFNGITSSSVGVEVETFPNYVAPQKDYEVIHIPGRNGGRGSLLAQAGQKC